MACRLRESASTTGRTTTSIIRARLHRWRQHVCVHGEASHRFCQWTCLMVERKPRGVPHGRPSSRERGPNQQRLPQKTTLPYEDNYLDLDPNVKDPFGVPSFGSRGVQGQREEDRAFMHEKMEQWYRAAGATAFSGHRRKCHGAHDARLWRNTHGQKSGNECRERLGFSHEVPNLAFWRICHGNQRARNPTLTLQAVAWRTAEYLARIGRASRGRQVLRQRRSHPTHRQRYEITGVLS